MKNLIKYYGNAFAKVAIGGFLIGMGVYFSTDGVMLYGAKKFMLNAAVLDEHATQAFMHTLAEKIGK